MKRKRGKILSWIDKLTDFIGGTMFFIMVALTGFNVLSFWTTGRRYGQLEEMVVSCLVWVTYISLGQHYREKSCIRADFLVNSLQPKLKRAVEAITDLAAAIMGGVVLFFGIQLMLRSTNKFTGVLKICYFWIDLGLVIGFASLLGNIILKYIPGGDKEQKEEEKA